MLRETTRSQLWLSAWVIAFSVAMACLLLGFKHRAALDGLQRARLLLVATETREVVERNLTFGISFTDIATLPDVLASTRSTEALIAGIDVVDADGKAVYSTDPPRRGHYIEMEWREAMRRAGGEPWHARDGAEAVQAAPIRNAFGLTLGHAIVRYRLDALDQASRQFVRYLALYGLAVAVAGTLALFLMLRWVQMRLERRLVRLRGAFESGMPDARAGSLAAEAAEARAKIDEARHALEAAEAALRQPAASRAPAGAAP
jgi:hypothetical protein